ANHLDSLPPGRTYELWLIPSDDRPPIPSGTFRPNTHGDASIVLPSLPRGIEAKAFGVTLEEENGAQSPTLPIVMAGQ
ncbi:MAG TPA: anti-sigma factor, partial [Edaphobacter sp.]